MGNELNAAEFTEEFCIDRWKAGEIALDGFVGATAEFSHEDCKLFYYKVEDRTTYKFSLTNEIYEFDKELFIKYARVNLNMRPAEDGGWIKHDGGECPIPWADRNDYQVMFANLRKADIGIVTAVSRKIQWTHTERDKNYHIIAYRLTDGWIPVLNGQCPEQAKGWGIGFQAKFNDGEITNQFLTPKDAEHWFYVNQKYRGNGKVHLLAIRRISAPIEEIYIPKKNYEEEKEIRHEPRVTKEEMEILEKMQDEVDRIGKELDGRVTIGSLLRHCIVCDRSSTVCICQKIKYEDETVAQKVSCDEDWNVTVTNIDRKGFYKPITQNEMMRIAGEAINGTKRQTIDVERDVIAAIRRNYEQ